MSITPIRNEVFVRSARMLRTALGPQIAGWLDDPEVVEVMLNPDGRLWLTGHDLGEAYVMKLPEAGSELRWVATVDLPEIQGQGIAWDRSTAKNPTFWAISRPAKQVRSFTMPLGSIVDPVAKGWQVLGPGAFRR